MKLEEYLNEQLKECEYVGEAVDLLLDCGVDLFTDRQGNNHKVYLPLEDGVVIRSQRTDETAQGIVRTYGAVYESGLAITGFVSVDAEYEGKDEESRPFFG